MRGAACLAVVIAGAFALLAAACSDGGDESATSYAQTERADYAGSSTTSASAGTPDSAGGGVASASLLGRTIIRDGSVVLEVESVTAAFDAVRPLAAANGGFVAQSSFGGDFGTDDDDDGPSYAYASLTLRIPAERFDRVIADLRSLAVRVLSASTSSRDVTGEVTDLESDLRNLRAVEAQYLELLGRASAVNDVLLVHDRLNQTRGQIERIEGGLALLESLADLSTIHVELQARAPGAPTGGDGLLDAARAGWDSSLAVLNTLARAGLAAAAFSWWLVPIVVVALVVAYRRGLLSRWPR